MCVFLPDHNRIVERIQQAHQRGVAVRILADNDKSGDLGSDIPQLKSGGARGDGCDELTCITNMHHYGKAFEWEL